LIKRTILGDIKIINLYAPNVSETNFIKQTLLNKKNSDRLHSITIIVGDLKLNSHQYIGHPDKKFSKESSELSVSIAQMELIIKLISFQECKGGSRYAN
jgi:hypothetical protein